MTSPITSADLVGWDAELEVLTLQVAGPLFTRPEPRSAFTDLIRGLLADVARKNSWRIGDHVGHVSGAGRRGTLGSCVTGSAITWSAS